MRDHRLVQSPTPADLTLAAIRRIATLSGVGPDTGSRDGSTGDAEALWAERKSWLAQARQVPFEPWQGQRLDLVRYSGSQHAEIEMHGVAGSLTLPVSPGPLTPLLAAALWLHLGKGTVMGMGQLQVIAIDGKHLPRPLARRNVPASGGRRPSWKAGPLD
jgi:CRISPR-associated endoribonuclease Cas6